MRKYKKKKSFKMGFISVCLLLLVLFGGFYLYISDYYHADEFALPVSTGKVAIERVSNLTVLTPSSESDTALIFYPGAKVEADAYLPILYKLSERGITTILVHMPFKMAIFHSDAAEDVFDKFPSINNWYIGGHSMGGAMASDYASKNEDKVDGLVLLGAYVYGEYPPSKALTVYGTFNSNLEKHIDYTENIVIIEGGNHAQFGNYGKQKGDPDATITHEEQQNITVDAIMNFIESKKTTGLFSCGFNCCIEIRYKCSTESQSTS